jgi:hypothetical protein
MIKEIKWWVMKLKRAKYKKREIKIMKIKLDKKKKTKWNKIFRGEIENNLNLKKTLKAKQIEIKKNEGQSW